MTTGTVAGANNQKSLYCEAGVRFHLDPAEPESGNYAGVEIDVPKSFDVRPDGIHLREWTREEDREKLTDGSPVLFADTLHTIPAGWESKETSVLTTTLGADSQPVSGVTIESLTYLPEIEVRTTGTDSVIKAEGKSATAAPSENVELNLSPREVNVNIANDTGGTRRVTATPVVEISNYGVLDVHE